MAGDELLVVSLDDSMHAATLSPTLPLGGTCNEILVDADGAWIAHSAGLLRLVPAAAANQAPELSPVLSRRNLDGIERDRDGTIFALEHPREVHGEAVERHAILRLRSDGRLDSIGTASPAGYDLYLDASTRRLFVTHLSGRAIERWKESNGSWSPLPELRIEDAAARDEPRDDSFWLSRLLFQTADGPRLLLEGREVRPRLLALEEGGLRRVFLWDSAFLARNGVVNPRSGLLALNAGRALFLYDPKAVAARQVGVGAVPAIALAASADGRWFALLFGESRERSVVEVWDAAFSHRALSVRVPGAASAIAFLSP